MTVYSLAKSSPLYHDNWEMRKNVHQQRIWPHTGKREDGGMQNSMQ